LHIGNIQKLARINPHDQMHKVKNTNVTDNQGDKFMNIDTMPMVNQSNVGAGTDHLLRAVQDAENNEEKQPLP
jgi:hypothetical protein